MSEYTTRPHVQTVTVAPHMEAPTSGAAVAAVGLAGAAVLTLLRTAGAAWASTRTDDGVPIAPVTGVLNSPRILRQQFSEVERQAAATLLAEQRAPVEALKMATALALERTPFHADAARLEAPVSALRVARNVAEVERARALLLAAVERDHLRLFIDQLGQAAAGASRAAGFETVEMRPAADGLSVRVVATDLKGRSLVSEVAPDQFGEVGLATEAVGITDGSCHTALDAFDAALEQRGVRSARPQRTATGGVCELAFARKFLRDRGRPKVRPVASSSSASGNELSRRREQNRPSNPNRTKA